MESLEALEGERGCALLFGTSRKEDELVVLSIVLYVLYDDTFQVVEWILTRGVVLISYEEGDCVISGGGVNEFLK